MYKLLPFNASRMNPSTTVTAFFLFFSALTASIPSFAPVLTAVGFASFKNPHFTVPILASSPPSMFLPYCSFSVSAFSLLEAPPCQISPLTSISTHFGAATLQHSLNVPPIPTYLDICSLRIILLRGQYTSAMDIIGPLAPPNCRNSGITIDQST
ncbi:hypothetical protein Pelo_2700 [Pelomyxa schiedti]|nr:hypothetical protein Pelo_2700 [Pelomyxa schiedti]